MAKKTQKEEEPLDEEEEEEMASASRQPAAVSSSKEPKAFEQMQQLGYPRYTFAMRFEQRDLNIDPRTYPVAKLVNIMAIKEDNGKAPYIGLGFVGILDEKLFLIVMERKMAVASAAEIKDNLPGYIGLEFFGVSRGFGPVGIIALSKEAYAKFAESI